MTPFQHLIYLMYEVYAFSKLIGLQQLFLLSFVNSSHGMVVHLWYDRLVDPLVSGQPD